MPSLLQPIPGDLDWTDAGNGRSEIETPLFSLYVFPLKGSGWTYRVQMYGTTQPRVLYDTRVESEEEAKRLCIQQARKVLDWHNHLLPRYSGVVRANSLAE